MFGVIHTSLSFQRSKRLFITSCWMWSDPLEHIANLTLFVIRQGVSEKRASKLPGQSRRIIFKVNFEDNGMCKDGKDWMEKSFSSTPPHTHCVNVLVYQKKPKFFSHKFTVREIAGHFLKSILIDWKLFFIHRQTFIVVIET